MATDLIIMNDRKDLRRGYLVDEEAGSHGGQELHESDDHGRCVRIHSGERGAEDRHRVEAEGVRARQPLELLEVRK